MGEPYLSILAVFDLHLPFSNSIGHEEVSYIDVSGLLTTRSLAIFLQEDSTLVILVNYIVIHHVSLALEEVSGPKYLWHVVVDRN
jgi:hypothetical protein